MIDHHIMLKHFNTIARISNYSAKGKGVEDLPDRLAEGKYGI